MKVIIVFFAFFFVASAISIDFIVGMTFDRFKNEFGKVYKNKIEMKIAEQAFNINVGIISFINAIPGLSFKLGLNEYSDKTFESFRENLLGIVLPTDPSERGNRVENQNSDVQGRSETEDYSFFIAPSKSKELWIMLGICCFRSFRLEFKVLK